ncbi:MAG: tRNA (N(6)-L-threonylcarbamoyladenosine(37)-C(2))-methylthiotransferase MtaB [Denitrovibrio sp.]|nr:MAG: tRNA (N(6)-L-threonylcarbamoyladenosine(37)-C(2))-methylthiotransferase MtaB [Denitrovibrio sp.]
MYAFIYTYGCKVNQVESEKIVNDFKLYNLIITDDIKKADVIILNTCAVTANAEKKFRSLIRRAKSEKPSTLIAVTGCAAEKDKEKLKSIGADIVVTNSGKMDVLKHISEKSDHLESIFDTHGFVEAENISMATKTRAFVKIQDGCDSNCAYCIIPSLRGLPVSRAYDSIISEIKNLVNTGYKEIVPVGIHVGKYGMDIAGEFDLCSLIEGILKIEGDFRIRLTSIEVNELTPKMISLLENNTDKICRHYHIPLQSGSSQTLERMNRNYTSEEYIDKLTELKRRIPDCLLGADVIVGFPGETDEHFKETLSTIEKSLLEHLHIFAYSDRSGTKASEMPNKINGKVKSERAKFLRAKAAEIKYEAAKKRIGNIYKVLTQKDNTGITDNYFTIKFKEPVEPNIFIDVLITTALKDGTLKGDILYV